MAGAKKAPLQSSSAHNSVAGETPPATAAAKRTIEEIYQKKTQLEHILLRPDTYVGSVEKHSQTLWVWEDGEMVLRTVTFVPGLYKVFDEILVNAADNKQRDPSMNAVKVEIDAEANRISVYNNGDGIPIEIHQEEGVYVPEMIFGHLLTSSNYDDNVKKTTGGRNGYGAKLTNIFSTEFIIETADGKRQKKYKQVFSENMGKKSEPSITKCKEGENWTKVTFKPDLAKFNMTHLEDDVVAIMKRRVVDLAGTLGKSVKVELNGQRINVKDFEDYTKLYLKSAEKSRTEPLEWFYLKVNDRWEVCVSQSEGQFLQVSFVNGIATTKGGTHVEYVTSQIANYIMESVNKKNKNANLKAHNVKSHLWVFVNSLIDNPAFDSQTKETLTTRQSSFGTKCELPQEFLKKVVAKSRIVSSLLSWAEFKQSKELKKTDGSKRSRLTGISKLEDANDAGTKNSEKCTLILTEGDSAKALAMAGVSVVGRDHYGVFPLRGKLLNVREASSKQIAENAEIQNIKKILGLQHDKKYQDTKGLRYGHLMIMTDQDHDGSHIKGLLINFFHSFWPSLLKIPSFMVEFITPIIRATNKRNNSVLSFYSIPEYEAWKESLTGKTTGWEIKYYKGLGTNTSAEGKEYFQNIVKHKKDFVWEDDQDGDAIELAFSKKKIEARKNWLRQFEPGTHLDPSEKLIKYSDFVNKELILFSMADLQRSIPSMVDGLKPGQRKILFSAFKRNLVNQIKVSQLQGYVSEKSAYHHGDQALNSTIIGMAQDFVGSNNIALLFPKGQFGTRHQGGKDHASARYIFTCLSPVTRLLFPKDDDVLLDYLNEDGLSIEPIWYVPIIPMVLVNGSEGIGTGWSSYIPNYNPKDIIANIRRLLNDEPLQSMDPWYRGFTGRIEKTATKETGVTYTISGIIEETDNTSLRITELPIRRWTQDYKEFLESMMTEKDKAKEPFIKDFREHNDDRSVDFEVILSEENLNIALQEGLQKKFKLTTTVATTNMHLFDPSGVIKKYNSAEEILQDFFHLRYEYYEKRKKTYMEILGMDLLRLDNKVRFVLGVVRGEIIVNNRKRADLLLELQHKGFTPFPKKSKDIEVAGASDATEEQERENREASPEAEEEPGKVKVSDYEYLLSIGIGNFTFEKVQELCAEKDRMENELDTLRKTSPKTLWEKDLDALEKGLDEFERIQDAERKVYKTKKGSGAAVSKAAAPKKPRKATARTSVTAESDSVAADTTVAPAVAAPRRGAPSKKALAKKKAVIHSDEEDDVIPALSDRLAAYNLDSSPDQSAMETDNSHEARGGRTTKAAVMELSDDDDNAGDRMPAIAEDEDFNVEEAAPKAAGGRGRGRKPAAKAAAAATTDTTKKRGGQNKKQQPVLTQTLITQVLKPAQNGAVSPEKKVRKMRDSPFNKKSGSRLAKSNDGEDSDFDSDSGEGSAGGAGSSETTNQSSLARNRPQRANRTRAVYVLSDSEDDVDEEDPATEDSDFQDDDD